MSTPMPSAEEVAAWRALMEAQALVVERVEAALAERGLPPLAWYDVLWALHEAPGRRARQGELARGVVMSRSGLSRLVDRIEAGGLLRREPCTADRRGTEVVLTDAGRRMLRRMWPVYGAGIARHFAGPVGADAVAVAETLGRVVAAARREVAAPRIS